MGLSLTESDLTSFLALMKPSIDGYNVVDALPDNLPRREVPAHAGRSSPARGQPAQRLVRQDAGRGRARPASSRARRVVLKDNVMLAGVPMMNGASTLEGYTPEIDATDRHPHPRRRAAPSSARRTASTSACPAAATPTPPAPSTTRTRWATRPAARRRAAPCWSRCGEVDMAIGGDQGGSIRMPASFCGIYGMKPTHGLVPYTGIMPIEIYVDHTGPMTATVQDNALLLEVIAGADGYDPRQYSPEGAPVHRGSRPRRRRPQDRRRQGGLRPAQVRARRGRQGAQGGRAPRQARREGHRGLDPVAHRWRARCGSPSASKGSRRR